MQEILYPDNVDIENKFDKNFKRYCFNTNEIESKSIILNSDNSQLFLYRLKSKESEPLPNIKATLTRYFILDKEGNVIGRVPVYHYSSTPNEAEIVYSLREHCRGLGIGTHMLKCVVDDIFKNNSLNHHAPNLEKLRLEINDDNIASKRIAEKNQFKQISSDSKYFVITKKDYLNEAEPE